MKVPLARLCLLFLLGVVESYSQTLNWASITQSEIVDSHGNPLDDSFRFQLGAFSDGFVPDETNIGNWGAHWNAFDTLYYTDNPGEEGYFYDPVNLGYFGGTEDVQNVTDYATLFQGLAGYIWITNDTKTEYFLASAGNKWLFPNLDPNCCPNGEVTTWSVSDLGTNDPVWGGQLGHEGAGEHSVSGPFDIQTYVVPEVGSSVLVLLGAGLAAMRRRRNDR